MRHILILILLSSTSVLCIAQPGGAAPVPVPPPSPTFKITYDTIYVSTGSMNVYAVKVKCSNCVAGTNYEVKNSSTGDLPAAAFTDGPNAASFDFQPGITEQSFFVTIHPTTDGDYKKQIIYQLFETGKSAPIASFYLRLEKEKLKPDYGSYRLLIGTNFDFIDGIDVKAPYYHLQVFQPKGFSSKFGFVGGFQRNRQVSFSDTINSSIKLKSSGVLYRLANYDRQDTLYQITKVDSVSFKRTHTSNIFSIYFEPTLQLFPLNNKSRPTNLYLFGHADIVLRKSFTEEEYSYSNPQPKVVKIDSFARFRAIPEKTKTEALNYEFYYGGGLMLHHDNTAVDIYAKFMIGTAILGKKSAWYYYGGEIGIREKSLNIMFGAEYRGTSKQYNPNYLNVYLSKVFSLGKLLDFISK